MTRYGYLSASVLVQRADSLIESGSRWVGIGQGVQDVVGTDYPASMSVSIAGRTDTSRRVKGATV